MISIILYNASDEVVESDNEEILLEVLLVGRKAPFIYNVGTTENSAKVHHYSVSVSSFEESSEKPLGLVISSHNSVVAGIVIRVKTVTGQVKNVGSGTANVVRVIATFYDGPSGTGNVVGVSLGASIPVNLNTEQEGSFTIAQDVTNREPSFVSYVLTPESLEYAMVPEFSASMIPIIFMMITFFAVAMTRKK